MERAGGTQSGALFLERPREENADVLRGNSLTNCGCVTANLVEADWNLKCQFYGVTVGGIAEGCELQMMGEGLPEDYANATLQDPSVTGKVTERAHGTK